MCRFIGIYRHCPRLLSCRVRPLLLLELQWSDFCRTTALGTEPSGWGQQPDMPAMGMPCRGIPRPCNKQTDVLPYEVSQTVNTFGCGNIFGYLECNRGLEHLLATCAPLTFFYGGSRTMFVCTLNINPSCMSFSFL